MFELTRLECHVLNLIGQRLCMSMIDEHHAVIDRLRGLGLVDWCDKDLRLTDRGVVVAGK